jgi:hypothetical protein
MGFRIDRTYVLQFEGAMAGAYIKIKATPVGVAMALRSGSSADGDEVLELLAKYVTEWNLDGLDGEPLPITAKAIKANLEAPVIAKIVGEWYKAATGVTAPLDPVVEEIPMDVPAG